MNLKLLKKAKRCYLCTVNNYQWIRLEYSLLRRGNEESFEPLAWKIMLYVCFWDFLTFLMVCSVSCCSSI